MLQHDSKKKPAGICIRIACVVFACAIASTAWADEVLDRAKQFMKEGKPAEAFALLAPLEPQRAGEIDYDYTLGTSALDSGTLDRAVIAFERILAVDPNFVGARLDLARTYFALGSDDLAKSELETVMKADPPANVRPIIEKYLAAIEARKKKDQPALVGYAEAGAGTDSNITAATNNFTGAVLAAYNLPQVQPTGNSIKREGSFTHFGAGIDYTRPIENEAVTGLGMYAGGDIRDRHYYNNAEFNYQQFDARGGLSLAMERELFRVGVQGQKYYQEGAAPLTANGTRIANDRQTFGYTGEWRHALAAGRQLGLFAQFNRQRFPSNLPQNINQSIFGGQFVNAWEAKGNPLLMLVGYQSRDRAIGPLNAAGTTDASKTLTGLRVYGQYSVQEKADVFATAGSTMRDDNSQFARSTVIGYGKDKTYDVTLGVNWRFLPGWSMRAQAVFFENRSNISLYEYKRQELSVTVRRDFK